MKKLSRVVCTAILCLLSLFGCSKEEGNVIPAAGDKPAAAPAGPTGRIRGVVRLKGDAPRPSFEPISENQNICGDRVSVSRLTLGKDNGVQHAFVYLDGVQSSEKFRARESLLVDQKNCQYA